MVKGIFEGIFTLVTKNRGKNFCCIVIEGQEASSSSLYTWLHEEKLTKAQNG